MKKFACIAGLSLAAHSATADDTGRWYIQAGVANISYSESVDITAGGAPLAGTNIDLSQSNTLGLAVGYFLNDNFSVAGIVGVPPTTEATGTGAPIAGLTLGEVTYAPVMLVGNYHFNKKSNFQPFIGGGIVYNKILDTEDNALSSLEVDDSFGALLRVGFDYMIDDNWGAFGSVNKLFLDHEFTGIAPPALGSAPVVANGSLDPLIVHAGVSYRF